MANVILLPRRCVSCRDRLDPDERSSFCRPCDDYWDGIAAEQEAATADDASRAE